MFDFIRKEQIWAALEAKLNLEIPSKLGFQLKSMQDLAVYSTLRSMTGKVIGEIGGGDSRILPRLSKTNECFNIEPFEGADNGPSKEVLIDGVRNIKSTIGSFDQSIEESTFDILFSVSVVEHVTDKLFDDFWNDCLRILKPNGIMVHAIDMYLASEPSDYWLNRFQMYKTACIDSELVQPLGKCFAGPARFTPDMASNPDNVMYNWGAISPHLIELRKVAQSVSLLIGVTKK